MQEYKVLCAWKCFKRKENFWTGSVSMTHTTCSTGYSHMRLYRSAYTRCQLLSALCQIDPTWATWGKQDLFGSKVSESFQSTVLGSLHSELIGKVSWSWQREHVAEATHLVTGGKQREEIQDRAGQDIVFHKHPPLLPTSSTKSLPPVFHRVPAAPSYWKSIRGLPIA